MASGVYNRLKYNLMKKLVDLSGDTIYVALMTSSHSFNAANNVWSDVSANETSGAGYTTNGQTLSGLAVSQDNSNNWGKWTATNVSWGSSTITAAYAVLYDSSVSSNLICCFDFSGNQSSSSGTFTIQWNTNGIITLS